MSMALFWCLSTALQQMITALLREKHSIYCMSLSLSLSYKVLQGSPWTSCPHKWQPHGWGKGKGHHLFLHKYSGQLDLQQRITDRSYQYPLLYKGLDLDHKSTSWPPVDELVCSFSTPVKPFFSCTTVICFALWTILDKKDHWLIKAKIIHHTHSLYIPLSLTFLHRIFRVFMITNTTFLEHSCS